MSKSHFSGTTCVLSLILTVVSDFVESDSAVMLNVCINYVRHLVHVYFYVLRM